MKKINTKLLKTKILEFLQQEAIMNLSTVNSSGQPRSNPMLFYIDKQFNFYFSTRDTSRKVKSFAKNKKVGLSVWRHNYLLVQAVGRTSEIKDKKQIEDLVEKLAYKSSNVKDFWPPLLRFRKDNYKIIKIKPKQIEALNLFEANIKEEKRSEPFYKFKI